MVSVPRMTRHKSRHWCIFCLPFGYTQYDVIRYDKRDLEVNLPRYQSRDAVVAIEKKTAET